MARRAGLLVAALALVAAAAPAAAGVGRVLVLTEGPSVASSHAGFLEDLDQVADELVVRTISDDSLQLRNYGTWLYSGVVILASRGGALGGSVDVSELIEFADAGGNVVLATDWAASAELRELSSRLGVELEEPGARVADWHRNGGGDGAGAVDAAADAAALVVLTSNAAPTPRALPQGLSGSSPLAYSGTALSVPRDSATARVLVRAEPSAVVLRGNAKRGAGWARKGAAKDAPAGAAVGLVAAVEGRGGAGRALVVGSIEALSDAAQGGEGGSGSGSGARSNRVAFASLAAWALGASGKLRAASFSHRVAARGGKTAPEARAADLGLDPPSYRVGDVVAVQLALEEFLAGPKGSPGAWVPFVPADAQLELDMLSPHVRVTLEPFVAPSDPERREEEEKKDLARAAALLRGGDEPGRADAAAPPRPPVSAAPPFPATLSGRALAAVARAPPSPGVFRWVLAYDRPGFSRLQAEHAVTVRPFSHDEFPRFLTKAAPYYAAIAATGVAFVLTGALFLYTA